MDQTIRSAFEDLKSIVLENQLLPEDKSRLANLKRILKSSEGHEREWLREVVNGQYKHNSNNFAEHATLLHVAANAQNWDLELVGLLMDLGADPMLPDSVYRSPLHWAVSHGCYCPSCNTRAAECVKLLLEKFEKSRWSRTEQRISTKRSLVDAQDRFGDTSLHLAARNLFPKPAAVMLDFGADVFLQNAEQQQLNKISKTNERLIDTIVQSIPSVLTVRLDMAIREKKDDDNYIVASKNVSGLNSNANRDVSGKLSHPPSVPSENPNLGQSSITLEVDFGFVTQKGVQALKPDGDILRGPEVDFFMAMIKAYKSSREKLFDHPVTEVFIDRKWKRVRWWFMISRSIFFIFACFFTNFVFIYYLQNCPYREGTNGTEIIDEEMARNECEPWWNTNLYGYLMTGFACLMSLTQISNMIAQKWEYVRHWKWAVGWWLLIAGVCLTSYPPLGKLYPKHWNHSIAGFTLFWFWTMILATYTRIPGIASYMQMLVKVISTVVFCVFIYGFIVLGFGFGFHVIFPENKTFKSPYLSFVKLLLMMLGDTDYDGIFENETDEVAFTIASHLFYAAFLILVTIVFMNLLIGLSVSDIQVLYATSRMAGISGQLNAIDTLEKLIFSDFTVSCYRFCCMIPFLQRIQDTFSIFTEKHQKLEFRPYDPNDKMIPKKLQFKLLNLYKSTFCRDSKLFASPKFIHHRLDQFETFDD